MKPKKKLFLYRVSQPADNVWYDTYDSFVCAQPDAEAARDTDPSAPQPDARVDWVQAVDPFKWHLFLAWCRRREDVTVHLLGRADPDVEPGVICASFNAG